MNTATAQLMGATPIAMAAMAATTTAIELETITVPTLELILVETTTAVTARELVAMLAATNTEKSFNCREA